MRRFPWRSSPIWGPQVEVFYWGSLAWVPLDGFSLMGSPGQETVEGFPASGSFALLPFGPPGGGPLDGFRCGGLIGWSVEGEPLRGPL
jgi:hypothetical protein